MARTLLTLALAALAAAASWLAPRLQLPPPSPDPIPESTDTPVRQPATGWTLLLDTSGSMSDRSKLSYAKEAIYALAAAQVPTEAVRVYTFDERATLVAALGDTSDLPALRRRLDPVQDAGSSNLYEGLRAALSDRGPAGRVVVFTDGPPNAGVLDERALAELVQPYAARGGRLDIVALDAGHDSSLAHLARVGGGVLLDIDRPRELSARLNELEVSQ